MADASQLAKITVTVFATKTSWTLFHGAAGTHVSQLASALPGSDVTYALVPLGAAVVRAIGDGITSLKPLSYVVSITEEVNQHLERK